jgi:hypothetical protein
MAPFIQTSKSTCQGFCNLHCIITEKEIMIQCSRPSSFLGTSDESVRLTLSNELRIIKADISEVTPSQSEVLVY